MGRQVGDPADGTWGAAESGECPHEDPGPSTRKWVAATRWQQPAVTRADVLDGGGNGGGPVALKRWPPPPVLSTHMPSLWLRTVLDGGEQSAVQPQLDHRAGAGRGSQGLQLQSLWRIPTVAVS